MRRLSSLVVALKARLCSHAVFWTGQCDTIPLTLPTDNWRSTYQNLYIPVIIDELATADALPPPIRARVGRLQTIRWEAGQRLISTRRNG